jgi:type I restriction enzyme S subunit
MSIQNNNAPNGFKMTELGPLPEDWGVVTLKDVFQEVDVRAAEFRGSDKVPVLSLTKNYGLMLQSERFEKRIALEDISDYKVVKRGEIVYNPYVIWEGAIHILDHFDAGLVSPVYPVLEVKYESSDPYFLDALLRTPLAISAYNRFAAGAVNRRRSIRKTDFLAIRIPHPPLPEQKAIAKVLSAIQKAIETQDKIIAAGKELKKSLMHHLFAYGPVPVSEAEKVPLKETEIGIVPENWEVVMVGDLVSTTQYGISLRGEQNGKYPILRMNNLVGGHVDTSELQYVNLGNRDFNKFRVNKKDILFNRTNSYELVGKTALFDIEGDYVFASYLVKVVPNPSRLIPEYLNYYLNCTQVQDRLRMLATRGVSQSNINATKLRGFKIPLPPILEQQKLAHIISRIDKKIEAEQNRRASLQALFRTTLHQLMDGKVRVKELGPS